MGSRMAPGLRKKLQRGEVRTRDMCILCRVAAKTKFFAGDLFEELFPVLKKDLKRRKLSAEEATEIMCCLASLNAYNADVFDAACSCLQPDLQSLASAERENIKAALASVKHDAGSTFMSALSKKEKVEDRRPACELFFRGQCK